MVQDYQYLNKLTIPNAYSLLLISELTDRLAGAKIFSKMDLQNGYNNLQIIPEDHWKAAFATHQGAFESTVMFYSMTNSPATFQIMMNHLLHNTLDYRMSIFRTFWRDRRSGGFGFTNFNRIRKQGAHICISEAA